MKRSTAFLLVVIAAIAFFWQRPAPDTVYLRSDGTIRLGSRVSSTEDVFVYAARNKHTPLKVRRCEGADPIKALLLTSTLRSAQITVDYGNGRSGCYG